MEKSNTKDTFKIFLFAVLVDTYLHVFLRVMNILILLKKFEESNCTYPTTTTTKSRIFHPLRKYESE